MQGTQQGLILPAHHPWDRHPLPDQPLNVHRHLQGDLHLPLQRQRETQQNLRSPPCECGYRFWGSWSTSTARIDAARSIETHAGRHDLGLQPGIARPGQAGVPGTDKTNSAKIGPDGKILSDGKIGPNAKILSDAKSGPPAWIHGRKFEMGGPGSGRIVSGLAGPGGNPAAGKPNLAGTVPGAIPGPQTGIHDRGLDLKGLGSGRLAGGLAEPGGNPAAGKSSLAGIVPGAIPGPQTGIHDRRFDLGGPATAHFVHGLGATGGNPHIGLGGPYLAGPNFLANGFLHGRIR
ncbi:hypothetical protein SAMN05519104_5210 [Rhizobiales bacterium GAS188]|nr:hypothetical protein SAMN05519104_5210 [Rhizobiales bacterium GAS188]